MNSLTAAQELFLRSTILNTLNSLTEPVSLSVSGPDRDRSLMTIRVENGETTIGVGSYGDVRPHPLSPEETVELLLNELKRNGEEIRIDKEKESIRLRLRGDSILRETVEPRSAPLKQPLWSIGKATHLDPNEAAPLLRVIGLMTPEGEIKAPMRKKFKQINHFLELVSPLLREPSASPAYTVVDCGCGKSYLGFVLYWYLKRVLKRPSAFVGIDISEKLIDQCRERADRLSLCEMRFQCSTIIDADFPKSIDLLVSLHACDTATDEAIACGVVENAGHIVVAPCCQHEIAGQLSGVPMYPLARHGIFIQRFGDLLTDMLRALFLEANGYGVTAGEFVSVEETPKNLLLRASYGNSSTQKRSQEYEAFKKYYRLSPSIDVFKSERELRRRIS